MSTLAQIVAEADWLSPDTDSPDFAPCTRLSLATATRDNALLAWDHAEMAGQGEDEWENLMDAEDELAAAHRDLDPNWQPPY